MSRSGIVALMTSFLAVMLGMFAPVVARAQETTPVAETTGVEIAPGVEFDLLPASEDPPSLYRLRFAPGSLLTFVGDPAISLVYIESGTLSLRMDTTISDARSNATSDAEENADEAVTLSQGDYFVLPPLVAGEIRNENQEPVSIVIAAITPGLIPGTASGTPVPK